MEILKETFKAITENIGEAVVGINKEGNIFIINEQAEKLLGIDSKKNIGMAIKKVIPNTRLLDVISNEVSESNKKFVFNNREFIINRTVLKSGEKIVGALGVYKDITVYKKMQHELNHNKLSIETFDIVMNSFNEWVVVVDGKGMITMMSKAFKEFLNCSDPEGKQVVDVIENTRMHAVIKTEKMEIGDIQEVKGNKLIVMRLPIKKDGKVVGAVGKVMFKDIKDFQSVSKKLGDLEKKVEFYKKELDKGRKAKYSFENIIGNSNKIQKVKILAQKASNTDSNVLITGESGTGKELFAHSIHNASKRCLGPFIKINCAAIPGELLEAELFGYEEGAFTGAKKGGKKGKFELANGGTIFLDEIGDMPMDMQVKLLRIIQEKEVERVGGNILKEIDVRIIAATNKNLENKIKEGTFREDLYYRLNVVKIAIPPLKERREDIPQLANALRAEVANRLGIYSEGISKKAMDCLKNYDWPGNIRELENIIERAINLLDSDLIIKSEHFPERLSSARFKRYIKENRILKDIIEEIEKETIYEYLEENHWNKNKVARLLGISRAGLYKKIEEYSLESVKNMWM